MLNGIQSGGGGASAVATSKHLRRFAKLDKNGDGSLDESELAGMAKRTGKSAADLLKKLDTSGDGKVDADEMEAGRPKHGPHGGPEGASGDGCTSRLLDLLKQLQGSGGTSVSDCAGKGTSSSDDMFAKADTDGDGNLSKAEFAAMNEGRQDLEGAATEFTSSLLNLLKLGYAARAQDGATEAPASLATA